jgi:hypothetical protein
MKINLEILSSAYLLGEKSVENLRTKELVPKMLLRRRLTRAAKLLVELREMVDFNKGRILCASAYGEVEVSTNILKAIANKTPISPTDFQNSVYSTAVSYLSIISQNQDEILTLSCGDESSQALLKAGAVKVLDKEDEMLLLCFETLNVEEVQDVNRCIDYLESAVALKVKFSKKEANIKVQKSQIKGVANSISEMLYVAQIAQKLDKPILEVEI